MKSLLFLVSLASTLVVTAAQPVTFPDEPPPRPYRGAQIVRPENPRPGWYSAGEEGIWWVSASAQISPLRHLHMSGVADPTLLARFRYQQDDWPRWVLWLVGQLRENDRLPVRP